nr:hypothetical protein CFP56_61350 [Quercus suber]
MRVVVERAFRRRRARRWGAWASDLGLLEGPKREAFFRIWTKSDENLVDVQSLSICLRRRPVTSSSSASLSCR